SYAKFLNKMKLPDTVFKNSKNIFLDYDNNLIDILEAEHFLLKNDGKYIIKPSLDSGGGKGVELLEIKKSKIIFKNRKTTFEELIKYYKSDFIVQKSLIQSKELSTIYPHSINTLRVITLRYNKEIVILSSVARFGNNGSVIDNQATGGISCGVDSDGILRNFGVDKSGKKHIIHPYTLVPFEGVKIPNYTSICEKLSIMHNELPYFDMISWDIAINMNNEPVLIELNLQGQEINFHQFNNGPLFGDYTEYILDKI